MRLPASKEWPARWAWRGLAAALAAPGLAACVGLGSHSPVSGGGSSAPAGTTAKGVQELYVSPGVLQHFLLPQPLAGPGGQQGRLDVVARDSAQVPRYGLLHLSVTAPAAVKFPGDTLLLTTSGPLLALGTARVLYTELKGKAVLTRLEAYLTSAQTTAYLQSPTKAVVLGGATGRRRFVPTKKAAAALQAFAARVTGAGSR